MNQVENTFRRGTTKNKKENITKHMSSYIQQAFMKCFVKKFCLNGLKSVLKRTSYTLFMFKNYRYNYALFKIMTEWFYVNKPSECN